MQNLKNREVHFHPSRFQCSWMHCTQLTACIPKQTITICATDIHLQDHSENIPQTILNSESKVGYLLKSLTDSNNS